MLRLQAKKHSLQVLEALQRKNWNGCEIFLSGNDKTDWDLEFSKYQSVGLWILSPLVRSIIDSLGDIHDNLIILIQQ